MRIVVSFGHAALDAGRDLSTSVDRFRGVRIAARSLHALLDAGHTLAVTHAHESHRLDACQATSVESSPLAEEDARADGLVGYLLEQELRSCCIDKRSFATVVTHTLVDKCDPAFESPDKLVGPGFDKTEAQRLERERHWTMQRDGEVWRRVVASPEPVSVLQSRAIATLLTGGHTVLCGGGGIAVVRDAYRREHGVEAQVDPDLGAARLALEIDADALLIATDVPHVYDGWPSREQRPLRRLSARNPQLERFAAGSMRPKVDAAARVARRGGVAVIGALGELTSLLEGRAGTRLET